MNNLPNLIEMKMLPEKVQLIIDALGDKIENEMSVLREAICYGDNTDIAEAISRIKQMNNIQSVLRCEVEDYLGKTEMEI